MLCIIPFSTFITMLYTINHSENSVTIMVLFYGLLTVCGCSYYLMYLFFEWVQKENSARYEAQLSAFQLSALQSRMEAVKAAENAIHANLALPQAQRVIRCKMVATPSIMLEISNPCNEDVTFDAQGLPVAHREGHSLGVQSISAFCQKNGAVCQFKLADDWFHLRLVL